MHSGELPYILGLFLSGPVADSEREISNNVQTYWMSYAKTRRPRRLGSSRPGRKYDASVSSEQKTIADYLSMAAAALLMLPAAYPQAAPGSHYWFLWRDLLGDFGSILFR